MSSMRLTNKETELLKEFETITDFNNKLCEEFLFNNLIDNEFFKIRFKNDVNHQTNRTYKYFNDIIEQIKHTDIYSSVSLHLKEKVYINKIRSVDFNINIYHYGYNKTVIPNRTNVIYFSVCLRESYQQNIYSLEEFDQNYNNLRSAILSVLSTVELIKENYKIKFEEFKTQFKSYDEIFNQYEILVNNWKLKNR